MNIPHGIAAGYWSERPELNRSGTFWKKEFEKLGIVL